ncbi:conserved hypothetical protein [Ricinus communis]|uniref:Uncharacterized protein n=1 Tax=Ricinus communis TaxID=3988 RepID=B9SBB0_RICCO|nr:conserved hypothetical protein [Ricinus communis]
MYLRGRGEGSGGPLDIVLLGSGRLVHGPFDGPVPRCGQYSILSGRILKKSHFLMNLS